jgi:endonuclease/exonuclease/phosphatase family metal-dependent hydrolase
MLTYNVHRCIGRDGRLIPARITAAIAEQQPDVVALQELDIGRARTDFADQVRVIADALGMDWLFHPAFKLKDEHYGDAILSRHRLQLMRADILPTLPGRPHLERRGAIWAALEWHGDVVQFITTHLGFFPAEQLMQAKALLGEDWLRHPRCRPPVVLLGDLNAVPGTRVYRHLSKVLRDPFPLHVWPPGTYPAAFPLLRIDHIMLSHEWLVHHKAVPRTRLTRVASDHLPVLVEASPSLNND